VEKYFVLVLTSQAELPEWNTITVKPVIIQEFCNYIIGICSTITGNKSAENVKKVVAWLKSALPSVVNDIPHNKSDEISTVFMEKKMEPAQPKAMGHLFELAAQLKDMATQLHAFAEESEKTKRTTAILMAENEEAVSKLRTAEETISTLQNQLTETETELTSIKSQAAELLTENEKLKAVISVYSEDKQSSMDGQLNAIASKLKTEYNEFKDALDLEMTAEIGEILRDQLMRVFKILSKAGIGIESR
jgi:chromosome segregation ATPase